MAGLVRRTSFPSWFFIPHNPGIPWPNLYLILKPPRSRWTTLMKFPSAIFADGVIYLTGWLYEEMPGAGNDYFNDTFLRRWNCDHRPPIKTFAHDKLRRHFRDGFQEFFAAPPARTRSRAPDSSRRRAEENLAQITTDEAATGTRGARSAAAASGWVDINLS